MAISVLSAAKFIGELSGWSKTNLELQKIIYIAHMFHLGKHKLPLVYGNFEAWNLGPVHPDLYHKAKVFGDKPVQDIFNTEKLFQDGMEAITLKETFDEVSDFTGSRLVAITHWEDGAWAKNYEPGNHGIVITNEEIIEEYEKRTTRAKRKQ